MAISLGNPFNRSRDTKEECESHLWGTCVDPAARYMTLTELTAGVPEKLLREIMEVVYVFELRQLVSSAKVKVIWSWTADYSLDLLVWEVQVVFASVGKGSTWHLLRHYCLLCTEKEWSSSCKEGGACWLGDLSCSSERPGLSWWGLQVEQHIKCVFL